MKLLQKQKEWKKGKETHKASRRRGQIRFNSAASASAISSACQRVWATLETLHCQPASLPACLPVAATLTVLSAQRPDSVPSSSQHTHVAFFITGYAHKCRTWRGCTVQVQEVEGEGGGEGGSCGTETTLWSAMQVKMYYGRRWTKVKWSKVNFITFLRVP